MSVNASTQALARERVGSVSSPGTREPGAREPGAREPGTRELGALEPDALERWWPLLAIVGVAALLRLATLGQQSLWFDEAFTPVHVFRPSLWGTLHAIARTENTPPLWYVLDWGISRVLGTGAVALRLLSALAGIATVPVAWAIARRLAGARAALVTAALVSVNPLFVWYSQEARAYGLFVLMGSLATLCFLRALERPTRGRLGQFALCASLALLTHYFAVFLLAPMVLWLALRVRGDTSREGPPCARAEGDASPGGPPCARAEGDASPGGPPREQADGDTSHGGPPRARTRARARVEFALLSIPVLVGAALLPLVLVQASHNGTQWIGGWSLASRLQAIPQYYLTGYSGAPLGHTVELLVALPALAGIAIGLRGKRLLGRERKGAEIALLLAGCGVLIPIALALVGVDYLAPRNLVTAMIPVTVLLAIAIAPERSGSLGLLLAGALALGFLVVTLDVDRSARLQRGDWGALAAVLRRAQPEHAVTTVHLGTAPLRYYLPSLHPLSGGEGAVTVREIDETGYTPLRPTAGRPPAASFHLAERSDVKGLLVYRFVSHAPVTISAQALRQDAIAAAHTEVLIPARR